MNFHGWASKFQREADRFRLPPWAFCPAKHGWKSFLTLTSFPAPIRHFKNLKGTWDKNLSCSHQLQSNFQLLKPLLHAQIFIWNVSLSQKDGVYLTISAAPLSAETSYMEGPLCWLIEERGSGSVHCRVGYPIWWMEIRKGKDWCKRRTSGLEIISSPELVFII